MRTRLLVSRRARRILGEPTHRFDDRWLALWIDRSATRHHVRLLATSPYAWHRELCARHAPTDVLMRDRVVRLHMMRDFNLRAIALGRRSSGVGMWNRRRGELYRDLATLIQATPRMSEEELRALLLDQGNAPRVAEALAAHPGFTCELMRDALEAKPELAGSLAECTPTLLDPRKRALVRRFATSVAPLTVLASSAHSRAEYRATVRRMMSLDSHAALRYLRTGKGAFGVEQLAPADLTAGLESDDGDVRQEVITLLGRLGDSPTCEEGDGPDRPIPLLFDGRVRIRLGPVRVDEMGVYLFGRRFVPARLVHGLGLLHRKRFSGYAHRRRGRWYEFSVA